MLDFIGWAKNGVNGISLYYVDTETDEDIMKNFTLRDGISADDVTKMSYDYYDRQTTEKLKSFHRYIKEDLCLKREI